MSGTEADYSTLVSASQVWDTAADGLDGAWRRLHGTSGSPMAASVSSAVEAFRETWVDEIKAVAVDAQSHAESLTDAVASYASVDDAAYERMRTLLPWTLRDSTLDPDGAPPPSPTPTPGPSPTPVEPSPPSEPAPPQPSPGPSPTPSPSPSGGE